jgi:hypothetical protein
VFVIGCTSGMTLAHGKPVNATRTDDPSRADPTEILWMT